MTKNDITRQIEELKTENIELSQTLNDPIYGTTNREIMAENITSIELLSFVTAHATEQEIRICQLALPGRVSVMRWAEKQMEDYRHDRARI